MNGTTATGRPSRGEAVEEVGQVDADAVGQGAPQRRARHGLVGWFGGGGGGGGEQQQQWDGGSRLAEAGVAGGVEQEMTNKRCHTIYHMFDLSSQAFSIRFLTNNF